MSFGNPLILVLLAVIPLVKWLRQKGWGRPATLLYPEAASVGSAFRGGRRPGSGLRENIRLLALALLILAAARPQQIQSIQQISSSGLDIMFALDMSGSMVARDFEPLNRLQAAKIELQRFVSQERNNRLGLVAFAAQAFTVCPLTLDYTVLLKLVEHLQIGMTTDGTAIGMAIATCVNRLKFSEAKSKVIILLTDGRNNAGRLDPITAAEIAEALSIRIYTIGMGQPGGAPIMLKNAAGETLPLLNADGSVYKEEVDEATLQKIAGLTGGKYFRATDKNKLRQIYSEIQKMEQARVSSKMYTNKMDLGHWLIAVVFVLLCWEVIFVRWREKHVP